MLIIKQGKSESIAAEGTSIEYLSLVYPKADIILEGDDVTEEMIESLVSAKTIKNAGGLYRAFHRALNDDPNYNEIYANMIAYGIGLKVKFKIKKVKEGDFKKLTGEQLRLLANAIGIKYNQNDAKNEIIKKIKAAQNKIFK